MRDLSLRARLLVWFLVPVLLVLSGGGYVLYRATRNVLEEELGSTLSIVAATISAQLKADRVLALTPDDATGEGSRTFRSLTAQVQEAKQASGVRRVLVFDTARRARLDVGGGLPPMAEAPELLRDSLELERVFGGEHVASQVLFEGNDGLLYKSGYAPLLQDGKVVGAVAVEGTAAFFGPLAVVRNVFLSLAFFAALLIVFSAVLSARTVSGPLERLVRAALRIGGGDLATPVAAERTLEIGILSRELETMRRALESRDRTLKMMLGGVAHEVKNPLGGIELFSGLLDEELAGAAPNTEEARSHVSKIRRELDYLKRIVEDFLVFAREQRLQRSGFDGAALVSQAVAHLQGEATAKQVTLQVSAASANVEGDESLLTSALVNLVKNAVQASPPGATVRVGGAVEGGRYVVEVADQGGGIAADQLARIFEPFFTTREKGTGLGLPLARKLVEAHRGTLTVRSTPGDTVFRVELPL